MGNPNHDPKNGEFTAGKAGVGSSAGSSSGSTPSTVNKHRTTVSSHADTPNSTERSKPPRLRDVGSKDARAGKPPQYPGMRAYMSGYVKSSNAANKGASNAFFDRMARSSKVKS